MPPAERPWEGLPSSTGDDAMPDTPLPAPQQTAIQAPAFPVAHPGARRAAGISLLIAGAGAAIGASFGGLWGAGAGLLGAAAVRNGARAHKLWASADPSERDEAASSVTMAIVGAGASAYLGYRAYQDRRLGDD